MTLRIKFEIVPFGDETRAREIKRFDIFNMGRVGRDDYCEYGVIEIDPERKTGGLYTNTIQHARHLGAVALATAAFEYLVLA